MEKYILTKQELETLLSYAHSYGRSEQFNYGLFGPDCKQAKPFNEREALVYCISEAEKIIGNPQQ